MQSQVHSTANSIENELINAIRPVIHRFQGQTLNTSIFECPGCQSGVTTSHDFKRCIRNRFSIGRIARLELATVELERAREVLLEQGECIQNKFGREFEPHRRLTDQQKRIIPTAVKTESFGRKLGYTQVRPSMPLVVETPSINVQQILANEAHRVLTTTSFCCPSCSKRVTIEREINACALNRLQEVLRDINKLRADTQRATFLQQNQEHTNKFNFVQFSSK